ncbi:hypothetical protein LCGC14_2915380, partial [marine sediment metagenome]
MTDICAYCVKDLPNNKNARYRWRGSEFCHPGCKAKFIEEAKPQKHEPEGGLRIIDGTPTAISKLIRENDEPQKQKGCGKILNQEMPEVSLKCGEKQDGELFLCPSCSGNHSPQDVVNPS